MDLRLEGQIVLVAGSSQGIGKAVARAFLAEGCRTVISGRRSQPLRETGEEFRAEFGVERIMAWEGDLTRSDAIGRALSDIQGRWGAIDCLVANIGSGKGKAGWETDDADWDQLLAVNLRGSARLATEVAREMTQARRGSIVTIASITGVEATPAPLPYSAAKAALTAYSKNLARSVAPYGVRVNSVAPGNVFFEGGSWEKHLAERHDEVMSYIRAEVPMNRFGRPEEIADTVVFLSSSRASFITGECVVVDGGQTRSF